MNDLISRQAAIDAIDVLCQEHRYRIPGKRETYSEYNEAWQDALDRAETMIFNLPSAPPEPCEYMVSAIAVEEMLNDLLPERGMWEIEGDEAKTAICETVHDALCGLWKLPFIKPDSKEMSFTHKALDTISRQKALDDIETVDPSMLLDVDWVKNWVKALPSAQVEHNPDDEKKIADLHKMVNYLLSQLEQRWIPCGKCIHADGKHRWCKILDRTINEDYFCYWAEPWKEGEADG